MGAVLRFQTAQQRLPPGDVARPPWLGGNRARPRCPNDGDNANAVPTPSPHAHETHSRPLRLAA